MEDFLDRNRSNWILCLLNMLKRRNGLMPRGAQSRQEECAASTRTLTFSTTSWYPKRPTNCRALISWVADRAKWLHRVECLPCLKKGWIQIQMMPQPPSMRVSRSSPTYSKLWPLLQEVSMENNKIHRLSLPTLWTESRVVKHRSSCASNHKRALQKTDSKKMPMHTVSSYKGKDMLLLILDSHHKGKMS